jgi:hypothetical protein
LVWLCGSSVAEYPSHVTDANKMKSKNKTNPAIFISAFLNRSDENLAVKAMVIPELELCN